MTLREKQEAMLKDLIQERAMEDVPHWQSYLDEKIQRLKEAMEQ